MFDSFSKRFLIINCTLFFDDNQHRLEALIDIDVIKYAFIDRKIAQLVCNMLNMKSVSLLKSKSLIEFDDRYVSSITHVIYFKLTIDLHFEFTIFMLIIDLNNHSIILNKSWMNKHEIILNMTYDKLIFKSFKCNHHDNISSEVVQIKRLKISESNRRWDVTNWRRDVIFSKKIDAEQIVTMKFRYTILFRSKIDFSFLTVNDDSDKSNSKHESDSKNSCCNKSIVFEQNDSNIDIIVATKTFSCMKTSSRTKRMLKAQRNRKWKIRKQQSKLFSFSNLNSNDSVNIIMIEAIFFYLLVDFKNKKQKMQCFFIIINQIDATLKTLKTNFESLKVVVMIKEILKNENVRSIIERIMKRVSKYFQHLFEIFDFQKITQLFSHRFYDHKIEFLIDVESLFRSRMYSLSKFKLRKLKKYLKKNLSKDFIVFNKIAFVSSILFAVKLNDQLRLCVDYRRLNHITKRNRYSISLIEKTLIRVQDCKYFIKLNIISIFNKLQMNENNEKFTIFVIFMSSYKYRVLFFELTNDSTSWQHYMNDLLFNYLNDFC